MDDKTANNVVELKKQGLSLFMPRLEADAQFRELAAKIEHVNNAYLQLLTEVQSFVESHNASIREQNKTNAEFARLIQGNRAEIECLKKKKK